MNSDLTRLRELARETAEYAHCADMERRRALWTAHNSFEPTPPPVYIRALAFHEYGEGDLRCEAPACRALERLFLQNRYRMTLADDYIIEPFLTVPAALDCAPQGVWGMPAQLGERPGAHGAAAYAPSIVHEEDIERLRVRRYAIDEQETARRVEFAQEAVGDALAVEADRSGLLTRMWYLDISTMLARLRGLEQIMWDCYDRPDWLHQLLAAMRDAILRNIDETEAAGGFRLTNHQNQAMPYARTLEPPRAGGGPVAARQLWVFGASQETTTFGPALFEEFMFRYQKPILERFGLCAYGCCEDLTLKIDLLRTLPNLRRIAAAPAADLPRIAESVGADYILSWRPNPTDVSFSVDEDAVRRQCRAAFDLFDACGCRFDITLKDVETVSGDPTAIRRWTQAVREEISRRY